MTPTPSHEGNRLDLGAGPGELPAPIVAVRDRLRAFIAAELIPAERDHGLADPAGATPAQRRWVRERAYAAGLLGLTRAPELGGAGLGLLGLVALHEAAAASGSALAPYTLGEDPGLLVLARGEQRERWLAPVLRGELTAALAFTDAPEGPRTIAVRRGDGFVVSGVKAFVTGGPDADLLVTVARVTENPGGPTGTAILVVPRHAAGVVLRRELRTLDGAVHGEFAFTGVAVPAADVLGEIGEGMPRALAEIGTLRLRAAAVACGTAERVVADTLAQVTRPHRTGQPLAEREQVQAMLAESAADLLAARAVTHAAARRAESGADTEVEIAIAKSLATEAVGRIVDRAIQLTGGAAVVEGHPLAHLYRRIRGWRLAEGSTEVLRLTIARGLLARHRAGTTSGGRARD